MKLAKSKRPSAREIEFDAKLLLESLRGHADARTGRGKIAMRTTTLLAAVSSLKSSRDRR